jgi:hypothetical protein
VGHPKPGKKAEFIRSRKGDAHITNCGSKGYTVKKHCQIHHILCVSCLQDARILPKGNRPYIRKCFKITDWDINAKPNVIGLPLKRAYLKRENDGGWDDLPCHQVDHNPHYTDGVADWLTENVWDTLKAKEKGCDVEPKEIAKLLNSGSTHWETFLVDRGAGSDSGGRGTRYSWEHRNDAGMRKTWHIPFSMHPGTPPERRPIPDLDKLPKAVRSALKAVLALF